mmetsp:Transcript_62637/g.153971  ORF Transcript_62637/g.153971 Transcript_62637/m.153971 type:complete len:196 (+) Transcript_62637:1827-2414(+)
MSLPSAGFTRTTTVTSGASTAVGPASGLTAPRSIDAKSPECAAFFRRVACVRGLPMLPPDRRGSTGALLTGDGSFLAEATGLSMLPPDRGGLTGGFLLRGECDVLPEGDRDSLALKDRDSLKECDTLAEGEAESRALKDRESLKVRDSLNECDSLKGAEDGALRLRLLSWATSDAGKGAEEGGLVMPCRERNLFL